MTAIVWILKIHWNLTLSLYEYKNAFYQMIQIAPVLQLKKTEEK